MCSICTVDLFEMKSIRMSQWLLFTYCEKFCRFFVRAQNRCKRANIRTISNIIERYVCSQCAVISVWKYLLDSDRHEAILFIQCWLCSRAKSKNYHFRFSFVFHHDYYDFYFHCLPSCGLTVASFRRAHTFSGCAPYPICLLCERNKMDYIYVRCVFDNCATRALARKSMEYTWSLRKHNEFDCVKLEIRLVIHNDDKMNIELSIWTQWAYLRKVCETVVGNINSCWDPKRKK